MISIVFWHGYVSGQTIEDSSFSYLSELSLAELKNLDVYSANRTEVVNLERAPAYIQIISKEQIELEGYHSLLDILRETPQIKVDFAVDPRWMNDITIRGIRGMDKFIILINGVRVTSPTNDVIAIMENYPVHLADQVEIMYGPASALYGADAFSGIINIKTPNKVKSGKYSASYSSGLYNYHLANFDLGKEMKNGILFHLAGQLMYDQQPDLSSYFPDEFQGMKEELKTGIFNTIYGQMSPVAPVKPESQYPLSAHALFGRLSYKGLSLQYFGNHSQNPSTTSNSPHNSVYNKNSFFGHSINSINFCFEKNLSPFHSISQVSYSRYDLDPKSNFRNVFTKMEPAYLFAYGNVYKLEQMVNFNMNSRFQFSGGATAEFFESMPRSNNVSEPINKNKINQAVIVNSQNSIYPTGLSANLIRVRYQNYGGFVQGEVKLPNKTNITIGTRADFDTRYGFTLNPRLSIVSNQFDNITIKFMAGRAFLAPSPQAMYDRYGTFEFSDSTRKYNSFFFQMPNEQLKPQKVTSYELMIKKIYNQKYIFGFDFYTNQVTGLISPTTSNPLVKELYFNNFRNTFLYDSIEVANVQINDNIGNSFIYGFTLDTEYKIFNSEKWSLSLYSAISFIDGTIDIDDEGPIGNRNLPGISPLELKTAFRLKYNKMYFSTTLNHYSKQRTFNPGSVKINKPDQYQEIEGYQLVNLRIGYNFKFFNLFFEGRNLLDQRFRNVNIGAAPQSVAEGSANVEFAKGAPQYPLRIYGGVQFKIN